jgi:hypothetical protein
MCPRHCQFRIASSMGAAVAKIGKMMTASQLFAAAAALPFPFKPAASSSKAGPFIISLPLPHSTMYSPATMSTEPIALHFKGLI